MLLYYYILTSTLGITKLGITTRQFSYRIKDHICSCAAYYMYPCIIQLLNSDECNFITNESKNYYEHQLHDLEKHILARTYPNYKVKPDPKADPNLVMPININNECRQDLPTEHVLEIAEQYLIKNNIKYRILPLDEVKDIMNNTLDDNKQTDSTIDNTTSQISDIKYFNSEEEILNYNATYDYDETNNANINSIEEESNDCIEESNYANINSIEEESKITMRDYQENTINQAYDYLKIHKKGLINWACGLGKTMISLLIMLKFIEMGTDINTALIGVPSSKLVNQWEKEIKRIPDFADYTVVKVDGSCNTADTIHKINQHKKVIVITTYMSSHKITYVQFDFVIYDEAHHLCGAIDIEKKKHYKRIFECERHYTLSLTATMNVAKLPTNNTNAMKSPQHLNMYTKVTDYGIIDNLNVDIFGKIIDTKTLSWAIENKYIVDYNIIVLELNITSEQFLNDIKLSLNQDINISLLLAAYASLYCIKYAVNNATHGLIYTNNTEECDTVYKYIEYLLDHVDIFQNLNVYFESIHSKINGVESKLDEFTNAQYGIISCAYMLNEGYDNPKINFTCFPKHMFSAIRIMQSLCRSLRLNKNDPDKQSSVILPTETMHDLTNNNNKFSMFTTLKQHDENIEEKIKCYSITRNTNTEQLPTQQLTTQQLTTIEPNLYIVDISDRIKYKIFMTDEPDIKQQFDKYKKYHKKFNFTCIADYINIKNNPEYQYCYVDNPKKTFKPVWNNNIGGYYEFLSIDCSLFPPTKDLWIAKCKHLNIQSQAEYEQLYKKYNLPLDYTEYYNINRYEIPWSRRIFKRVRLR